MDDAAVTAGVGPVRWRREDRGHGQQSLRAAIASHRRALEEILGRYGATNARLFGSVARGDATPDSDIDLTPDGGNELLRVAGIAEELTGLPGTRVDVVATSLLRGEVSSSALADAVAV
ncbi:nucleotidyltransferase family protein [Phycicoccus avicenniae]|uniref:nucleotidyltransferase family protein n=1 Tax=Phycicoccus avicenniae TaxID=2828860 RepID=UPI002013A812|nr:nucleotidyltransferase domain-containing protein [Phycicoccus avicenniae]